MVNRKEDQGQTAIDKIKAECEKEGTNASIEWERCDLGSLKMVKEVITRISGRLDRLDLVSGLEARKELRTAYLLEWDQQQSAGIGRGWDRSPFWSQRTRSLLYYQSAVSASSQDFLDAWNEEGFRPNRLRVE